MPRYVKQSTFDKRANQALKERKVRTFTWVDPFPLVHGTLPEKMVYAALTKFGIPFLFLNDLRIQIPEIDLDKFYQADFIIPHTKIIIEVQGAYWHSKPETIESDAFKFALYEAQGYKILSWWDYDIIANLDNMILAEPQLMDSRIAGTGYGSTELPVQRRTKVDTSKGIRTLNSRRFRQPAPKVASKYLRRKKVFNYGQ